MEVFAPSMPLVEKLQIKDEKNLLIQGLPSTVERQFNKISFAKNLTPLLKSKKIDFALIFAVNQKQLKDILKEILPSLHANAKLWIAHPKVSSKIVSDLSRDCNWSCVQPFGLEPQRKIEVDPVWCASSFKRTEMISLTTIKEEVFEEIELKTITVPVEVERLFTKNKKAHHFFETLSYNNKKEYVVWITSAKREETRQARISATIEKLSIGLKSPSAR